MDKRGLLMLEQIIKLLIAVIVISLIIYAGVTLFRTYIGRPGEMKAKGTLNKVVQTLEKANESGITEKLLIYTPKGWYIVAFDSDQNENHKFKKPSVMFNKNCVCVCQGGLIRKICRSEICREIKMPLKKVNEQAFIKIEIKEIWIANMKTQWDVSEKPIVMTELTDEERQEYGILKIETKKDYGDIITKTAQQHYSEVSKHFDNATDFSNFLLAMIIVESSGNANAKSKCGAVGLMQLMPDTARGLGLNVPDYTEICNEGKPELGSCSGDYSGCSYAFECNKINPQPCDEKNDERFNPEKNIEAGTKYVVSLIKQFDDKQLALVAYIAGPGNVQKSCKPLTNIRSCPFDFAGKSYSEKVTARYFS